MESVQWLLLNADKISVISILAMLLVALQRQWLVLGWAHRECVRDRDRFEAKVEAIAKSNEEKLTLLNSELALLRDEFRRRR